MPVHLLPFISWPIDSYKFESREEEAEASNWELHLEIHNSISNLPTH